MPELPYPPNALEAAIDTTTMQIHHGKHHAGYVRNLNTALEGQTGVSGLSAEAVIQNLNTLPNSIQTAVRNNGGGAVNHAIFWKTMSPDGGGAPTGALADALNTTFGSTDGFKQEFSAAARTCFGSGWAWLAVKPTGTLAIYHLPNQDSPYMQGDIPLLGLDVWEHAYYLRYQNRRGDYINNFWKVVNWPEVGKRMTQAKAAFA
ncbi:MAG: superoxide dismutase [Opitutales bacterium]